MASSGLTPETMEYRVEDFQARLDSFLSSVEPQLTRSQWRGYIRRGCVLVNASAAKAAQRLRALRHGCIHAAASPAHRHSAPVDAP